MKFDDFKSISDQIIFTSLKWIEAKIAEGLQVEHTVLTYPGLPQP